MYILIKYWFRDYPTIEYYDRIEEAKKAGIAHDKRSWSEGHEIERVES